MLQRRFTRTGERVTLALALTLTLLFSYAAAVGHEQAVLSDKLLRLHVIANSDSAEDQRVKLAVRDRVLTLCTPLLADAKDAAAVRAVLSEHLQELVNAAQEELWAQGSADTVTAQLRQEYYPTRTYTNFALPAGRYTGLKLRIGNAQGHNWWCVVFPPLCTEAATGVETNLDEEEQQLIASDGQTYALRFKTAELVGKVREALARK